MEKFLLGIDNGGTMTKAAIFTLEGKEVAVESCNTEIIQPKSCFVERDMREMWLANVKVIKNCIAKAKIDPTDILSVSTTGHGNGLYLIDYEGKPAYNGIISTDSRAQDYVDQWYANGTHEQILPKTMQSLWAGQPAALVRWLLDNEPEVMENTRWILMCKDYIRYMLTGKVHAEITDISGTSLVNVRDVCYDVELLRTLGLDKIIDKLPPIRYSGEVLGTITEEVSKLTGLKEGTPVAGGLFDIDACAIASGVIDEDKFSMVAGTWSINQFVSKHSIVDKDLFMTSLFAVKDHWLVTEASPTSASNLEWFIKNLMHEECDCLKAQGRSVYDLVNQEVASVSPEQSDVIFLPFLYGSNVHPRAKSCFIGLANHHTRADMLRAVFEGIAFSHRYHTEKIMKHFKRPSSIRISGGAANSPLWMEIFADIMQMPIEFTEGTELGALGAAICAGVSAGVFDSYESAAAAMVTPNGRWEPNPDNFEIYDKKYKAYRQVIDGLDHIWH